MAINGNDENLFFPTPREVLGKVRVERRAPLHSMVVVLDDFLQCREAPVVHVGRGEGDVAQARHHEAAVVCGILRDA